jgi:hypothetical protein
VPSREALNVGSVTASSPAAESPFRVLLRRELRRKWGMRAIRKPLLIFGLILAAQLTLTWLVYTLSPAGTPVWLYVPLLCGQAASGGPGFAMRSPDAPGFLFELLYLVPGLLTRFFMPAFAAQSVAPERESSRVQELLLAGLTPQQILLALGLGAVGPFVVLTAACSGIAAIGPILFGLPDDFRVRTLAYGILGAPLVSWLAPVEAVLSLTIRAMTLVCISALSRRTAAAIVVCYAAELFLLPVLWLLWMYGLFAYAMVQGTASSESGLWLELSLRGGSHLLSALVLALLWRAALKRLEYPDERAGEGRSQPGGGGKP